MVDTTHASALRRMPSCGMAEAKSALYLTSPVSQWAWPPPPPLSRVTSTRTRESNSSSRDGKRSAEEEEEEDEPSRSSSGRALPGRT